MLATLKEINSSKVMSRCCEIRSYHEKNHGLAIGVASDIISIIRSFSYYKMQPQSSWLNLVQSRSIKCLKRRQHNAI